MSVKRPPRRYIGIRYEPQAATRREVTRALESLWRGGPAPRLLVCEEGSAIVLVARGEEARARKLLEGAGGAVRLEPIVTSGTIAAVKKRLRAPPAEAAK